MAIPVPVWVDKYVGLPFKSRGRTIDGLDCWGLCLVILSTEFGINLVQLNSSYKDTDDFNGMKDAVIEGTREEDHIEIPLGEEKLGDIICFKIRGVPCHVGLVITPGYMLHVETGANCCFVPYNNLKWQKRISGIYRVRKLV